MSIISNQSNGVASVAAEAVTPPTSAGPYRIEFLGGTIRAGRAVYQRQVHMGHEFAVLDGKSLQDKEFVFAIKKDRSSGREFFVHIPTKHKSWDLPDRSNPHAVAAIDIVLANPWRERFIAFYKQYNADKLPFVDPTLAQFPGRERVLMNALVRKYGAEPGHEDEYEGIVAEDADEATPQAVDVGAEVAPPLLGIDESLRKRVTRFIAHYKPSKATPAAVDKLLTKYAGHEAELIQFLIDKFGPEPPESAGHECDEPVSEQPDAQSPEKEDSQEAETDITTTPMPALNTAAIAGERNVLLREQSLMGFLQDREARLESALSRNSDLTSELDELRSRNETLLNEAQDLRNLVEIEARKVDGSLSRLHHDASVTASTFELERTKLRQQLQEELLGVRKRHGDEQVLHERAVAQFSLEKSALKGQLSMTKEELDSAMRRTSELISALDKREITNVELRRENEKMRRKLNPERADSASQTDELGLIPGMVAHVQDERLDPQFVASHEYISKARIVALENALHRARQDCERQAAELNKVNSGVRARSSQYDTVAGSPTQRTVGTPRSITASSPIAKMVDTQLSVAELKDRLSHAYATVSSLRTANKHLESRVGHLELKVISMPNPDLTPRNTQPSMLSLGSSPMASRIANVPDEATVIDMEEDAVTELKEKLAASQATIRVQKGEINDLRMLLARYMAYSSGATPNRKATANTSTTTPKASPSSSTRARKPLSPAV